MALEIKNGKLFCKGKSCKKKILLVSAALKHINRSEDCKKEYTADQLKGIGYCSRKRTEQKDLKRRRENYDPKKRAFKHKRSYDPIKRKAKYQKDKKGDKKFQTEPFEDGGKKFSENENDTTVVKNCEKKDISTEEKEELFQNESLIEHKCVVIVESISLENNQPVFCTVRHKYLLFGDAEFVSPTFSLETGSKGDEENGLDIWEHIIAPQKMSESEVKNHLKSHPLEISLYEKDDHLGTAEINLGEVYDPKSQKKTQKSFKQNVEIKSTDGNAMGEMGFFFVLVTEEFMRCKSKVCKTKIMKTSSALKHISHSKECKKEYSEIEMQSFRNQAKKRKSEKEIERQREKYDATKRAKKHNTTKNNKMAEMLRINEENAEKGLTFLKQDMHKKLIAVNSRGYQISKQVFDKRVGQLEHLDLCENNNTMIRIDKETIVRTEKNFKVEINEAAEKVKNISRKTSKNPEEILYDIYINQLANVQKNKSFFEKEYDDRHRTFYKSHKPREMIGEKWLEVMLNTDSVFKDIAIEKNAKFIEYERLTLVASLYNNGIQLPDANCQVDRFKT